MLTINFENETTLLIDTNGYTISEEDINTLTQCLIIDNYNWTNFDIEDEFWIDAVENQYLLKVTEIENNVATTEIICRD